MNVVRILNIFAYLVGLGMAMGNITTGHYGVYIVLVSVVIQMYVAISHGLFLYLPPRPKGNTVLAIWMICIAVSVFFPYDLIIAGMFALGGLASGLAMRKSRTVEEYHKKR
jgi:hypothetical protein